MTLGFNLTVNVNEDKTYTHEILPVYTDTSTVKILKDGEGDSLMKRLTELSHVLEDDSLYRTRFYAESASGGRKLSQQMKKTLKKKGIMYILSRFHRIRTEDLKIKLYSMLHHPDKLAQRGFDKGEV